ncbi:MAG: CAP domain-containing protein [Dehalococcoidia bacterium]|nr:CAP domain-containing protein [Dehalococcoidia bacterium]
MTRKVGGRARRGAAALLGSKERLSPNTRRRSTPACRPHPPRLSAIPLFAAIAAIVAVAALSLSCTWQEQMEQGLAVGVNQLRAERGLPPLVRDPQLSAIARMRAEDMANYGYFSHTPPDGCGARCLMERAGMTVAWAGEVIAWNNTRVDQSADMTIALWRNSPQHLGTIINGCFTRMGTGSAFAGDGRIYHVAVFEGRAPGC